MLNLRNVLEILLASVFGAFFVIVAAVFIMNLRRSQRQEVISSAISRPESVYVSACIWLFIPGAVARCVLLSFSALSANDDGINFVLSVQALLVFDIALFSCFSFCKLLLNGANFQYLHDTFKIRIRLQTRASSINAFLVILVPFFLAVVTSAVLWSYQICTTSVTSSDDMIVHSDVAKNRSLPSLPDSGSAPSLSQDIYLVSSYHFILLSATICACCIVGAFFVYRWKRQRDEMGGSSGVTSDAQHLAARLEKVNILICLASIVRLIYNVLLVMYPSKFQSILTELMYYPSIFQGTIDLLLEALPITVAIVVSSTICSDVPIGPRESLLRTPSSSTAR